MVMIKLYIPKSAERIYRECTRLAFTCFMMLLCLAKPAIAEEAPTASRCCDTIVGEASPPVENSLSGFMSNLFDTSTYPARWNCGTWTPLEGWLHILSDIGIFIAYFSIPVSLLYFIAKRGDVPWHPVIALFAAFILFCGAGHLLEAIIFYYPIYRFAGLLKLATAVVSLTTLFVLLKLIPRALELPGLVTRNEMLVHADRMKSAFLANMSHEIRTPMTAIVGFAELLDDESISDADRKHAVQTIRRTGSHLVELINDILDLSKVEAGELEVEQRDIYLPDLVSDLRELLCKRAESRGNTLEIEARGSIPETIQSDPTRLKQALVNLLGNAMKFTENGSVRLEVACDVEKKQIRFQVIDSGIGMTPEQLTRIFVPFNQADASTTRKYGGTGLGLTITKQIAAMLGGDVQVQSELGVGSRFTLCVSTGDLKDVPKLSSFASSNSDTNTTSGVKCQSLDPADAEGPSNATPKEDVSLSGIRILLAEDGLDNQRLISFLLKKAGADVTIADNGEIGYALATSAMANGVPFNVVLMDMQMPVLDGYAATNKLREAKYNGPIIALTAHAMDGDRQKCLDAGCDDYLTKPIDRSKLLSMAAKFGAAEPALT